MRIPKRRSGRTSQSSRSTRNDRSSPAPRRTAAALALAAALVPATAGTATAHPHPHHHEDRLQQDADALHDTGVTGVSVRLETPRGTHVVRSGVGDLTTGKPVPWNEYLRNGSTTKTYVATVLLQLAGEGRVSLEDTVDEWLPGVVRGQGNDGRRITLRQLLQHTSRLPDYTADVFPKDPANPDGPTDPAAAYRANRLITHTSEERVSFALRHPPVLQPGETWDYSNTNYILAGMVIKAVTGRSWEHEVRARILRPLGLTHTLTAGDRPGLPRPHARFYQQFTPGGPMTDTTAAYLPFDGDADGSMISTAKETNAFFKALLRGKLLKPAQLAEMRRTVDIPDDPGSPPGTRDGLGVFRVPLSCGGAYWGHDGNGFGYMVSPAVSSDGRTAVTVYVHSRPGDQDTAVRQLDGIFTLVDHALCDSRND